MHASKIHNTQQTAAPLSIAHPAAAAATTTPLSLPLRSNDTNLELIAGAEVPALLAVGVLVVDVGLVPPLGEGGQDPPLQDEQPADVHRADGRLDLVVPRGGFPSSVRVPWQVSVGEAVRRGVDFQIDLIQSDPVSQAISGWAGLGWNGLYCACVWDYGRDVRGGLDSLLLGSCYCFSVSFESKWVEVDT